MYMYIHIERLSNRFAVFRQTDLWYFVKQICGISSNRFVIQHHSSKTQCPNHGRLKH